MHPILWQSSSGSVLYSYGTLLGLSFAVGFELVARIGRRDGLDPAWIRTSCVWTALGALALSRLLFVVTNPGAFTSVASILDLTTGGVVAYGGFLGGLLASWVHCRRTGVSLLVWADCAVPALCTGLMVTRIGCLLAGCDFGRPWAGPLGLHFPRGAPAFLQHVQAGLIPSEAAASLPVHPTQLYESLAGLLLLALVFWVRGQRGRRPGDALAAFTLGYAVLRFAIEIVRGDGQRGSVGVLSTSQVIAVTTFLAGSLWLALRRNEATAPDA